MKDIETAIKNIGGIPYTTQNGDKIFIYTKEISDTIYTLIFEYWYMPNDSINLRYKGKDNTGQILMVNQQISCIQVSALAKCGMLEKVMLRFIRDSISMSWFNNQTKQLK